MAWRMPLERVRKKKRVGVRVRKVVRVRKRVRRAMRREERVMRRDWEACEGGVSLWQIKGT